MITTITLNASIDKAYFLDNEIGIGKVMRVKKVVNTAGGKGINVAKIINICNEKVLASGIIGGFNGDYLQHILRSQNIKNKFLHCKGETRSCINIINQNGSTEFLEPGFNITKQDEKRFLKLYKKLINKSEIVTISGSVAQGFSIDIYSQLISIAKEKKLPVILDTSGKLLAENIKSQPTVVKPNKEELESLFNITIQDIDNVKKYSLKLNDMGIEYVLVSLGAQGAMITFNNKSYLATPPKIEVKNTVGCGDSLVGAFAVGLKRKWDIIKTLKYAVAVASANALTETTGNFDPNTLSYIISKIEIKNI